ncbi:MAG: phosphoenolpyruvate--protein phosphotransferase, partial [Propionibacteriaceae bacterium]|nr:phosphoenolpyruvate--protein phosphotransferase [Propionibacteriaceae bacterium]
MIGIVVVSHSRPLATAAVALASQMAPAEARPRIEVAAGLSDTEFGTDAAAIAEAVAKADSPAGVVILTDLGSAVLSSEMALELVEPAVAERALICPAPLVEGLIAAVVTASTGADRAAVAAEANAGLAAKIEHLGGTPAAVPPPAAPAAAGGASLRWETVIANEHGLHVRPAAYLVAGLRGLDA